MVSGRKYNFLERFFPRLEPMKYRFPPFRGQDITSDLIKEHIEIRSLQIHTYTRIKNEPLINVLGIQNIQ